MKRTALLMLCGLLCAALCGCTVMNDPLAAVEVTPVPGLDMRLHAAAASDTNTTSVRATLYFRFMDQPMLASETRTLHVKRDESAETALVRTLLEGPSAVHVELTRLFAETVQVEHVSSRGDTLYVTFSEELLSDDVIPIGQEEQALWMAEAPTRRALALQSVVASITETFAYSNVQFLVDTATHTGTRLDYAYLLTGATGPMDPITRDEGMLLTPHNTVCHALEAWHARDWETLYAYTAANRPVYADFARTLDSAAFLESYEASAGSVSVDGASAVLVASLTRRDGADARSLTGYPIRLLRENGLWKLDYEALLVLTLADMDERSSYHDSQTRLAGACAGCRIVPRRLRLQRASRRG